MFLSLFQTPTGAPHVSSILMISGWFLSSLVAFLLILANLRVNRDERNNAFQKEQQSLSKITELEKKTMPLPLKKRLIACLDRIDKNILIVFLHSGKSNFEYNLMQYQRDELQKLSDEPGASRYISLTVSPNKMVTRPNSKGGILTSVSFELKQPLLK